MKTTQADAGKLRAKGGNIREIGSDAAPALPHERDESTGATGGEPSKRVQQAHEDVQRGLRDTDRGQVADLTYRKLTRDA